MKKNCSDILNTSITNIRVTAIVLVILISSIKELNAQSRDTTVNIDGRAVTLSEVFIRSNTDVKGFISRVRTDTSFYKAFRNLRILNYTALNDVRMMDKKGRIKATLYSRTQQDVFNGCRITKVLEEKVDGDFYDRKHEYKYYTAEMYDGLFFAFDTVCGETNIVKGEMHSIKGKSGIEKHKEQLKMLFFNPGEDIPGIPLMGDKVQIFDKTHAPLYDFGIDMIERYGTTCYVFTIKAKEDIGGKKDKIVIDEMITWFDYKTFEVLARTYNMSYGAGVYNFDVSMDVEMKHSGQYLYPAVIRYNGNWGVFLKGRERGVFTATIFDVH